jgi:putative hydrolase of the HAD superfamily
MKHSKHRKTVILDLGNVVLEWNVERILDSLVLEPDERNMLRDELFAHQDWLDLDHGKVSEKIVVEKICARSPLDREIVERTLFTTKNSLVPFGESVRLMQDISNSGIEMFCLSNMSRETWNHIKDQHLFEMFSGIVISGLEGCIKPDEEIFHLILDRFAIEPSTTLFVDDSLPNIETSRRLGINGFHFRGSQDCYAEIRHSVFGNQEAEPGETKSAYTVDSGNIQDSQ